MSNGKKEPNRKSIAVWSRGLIAEGREDSLGAGQHLGGAQEVLAPRRMHDRRLGNRPSQELPLFKAVSFT